MYANVKSFYFRPETEIALVNNKKGHKKCPVPESNQRHVDFQSTALPTELTGHLSSGDRI